MSVDVCVVGAGPSGAIAALELARLGFRVRLLHSPDPRKHWPETVSPSLCMLLDRLGLGSVLTAATCVRVSEKWLGWHGENVVRLAQSNALVIDRDRFDPALRDHALRAGVEIVHGRAGRPVLASDGMWCVPMDHGATTNANFIVIAAGRGALGRRAMRDGARMVAYHGVTSDAPVPFGTMVVGSTRHTWYWGAAMSDGSLRILVFKASGAAIKTSPIVALQEALGCIVASRDRPALQFVCATDATARSSATAAGENWIRTGDALLTVDPLNGSGLYAAILSSVQAARVINTVMRRRHSTTSALAFYTDARANIAEHCAGRAGEFYRAGMRDGVTGPPDATEATDYRDLFLPPGFRLAPVPVLVGDYVSEHPGIKRSNKRSIAFVEGQPIVSLLAPLLAGKSLKDTADCWSQLSPGNRDSLMHLLAHEGIVVSAEQSKARERR